jgi:hypothetical protein
VTNLLLNNRRRPHKTGCASQFRRKQPSHRNRPGSQLRPFSTQPPNSMASSSRAPTGPNSLLDLPGEVRNQIYTFVLSAGLGDIINLSRGSEDRSINQLQHVCRQLYDETRLLECKLNSVGIIGQVRSTPKFDQLDMDPNKAKNVFLDLTHLLGASRLLWIENLVLSNSIAEGLSVWAEMEEIASTMLHLTDVLRRNPALRVRYNMTRFCRANLFQRAATSTDLDLGVIFRGILVSSVLRNDPLKHIWTIGYPLAHVHTSIMKQAASRAALRLLMQATSQTIQLWSERIRVFPDPDIATAQPFVLGPDSSVIVHRSHAQELLPLWAALIGRWVKEGL